MNDKKIEKRNERVRARVCVCVCLRTRTYALGLNDKKTFKIFVI